MYFVCRLQLIFSYLHVCVSTAIAPAFTHFPIIFVARTKYGLFDSRLTCFEENTSHKVMPWAIYRKGIFWQKNIMVSLTQMLISVSPNKTCKWPPEAYLALFKCFPKENKNSGPAKQQVLQSMHSINTFSFLGWKKMAWEEDHRPTD